MRPSLIRVLGVGSVLAFGGTSYAYTATKIQVTNDPAQQFDPAVSKGRVAWTDLRNGNADIYAYDIASGVETQVTSGPANESLADINLDTIVFTSVPAGSSNADVYEWDFVSAATKPVATSPVQEFDPAVSSSYIVWTSQAVTTPPSPSAIWALDRTTAAVFQVSPSASAQLHPVISGTIAVWQEPAGGALQIRAKDVLNGTTWNVTSGTSDSTTPDIDGNYVVYANGGHIFWYDLSNGAGGQITTTGTQSNPHVSGSFVVWEDHTGADSDLYGYNIQTAQLQALATGPGDQFLHDVSGYDIAYTDNSAGNTDIWVIHITPDAPVTDPCAANSGAPLLFDETFARQRGDHHEKHRTFTAPAGMTAGTVCVDVTGNVSAEVELNEADIVNPSDFRTTDSVERAVTLLPSNRLEVEVTGHRPHGAVVPHDHHHHGCDGDNDEDDQNCGSGGSGGGTSGDGNPGNGSGSGGTCDTGTVHVRVVGPLPPPSACTATIAGGETSAWASFLLAGVAFGLALARRRSSR